MQQKDDEEPIGDEPRSEVRLFNWRFIMIHWSFMKFQWRFGSTSLLSMFRQACDRGSAHWPGQGFTALPLYCHWVNSSSLLLPSGTRWVEHGQEEETGQGQAAQESMTWHFDGMLFVSSQWDKACALMPWSRKRRSSRKIKRRKSRKMKRRQRRQHSGATYIINASIKVVYYILTHVESYMIFGQNKTVCAGAPRPVAQRGTWEAKETEQWEARAVGTGQVRSHTVVLGVAIPSRVKIRKRKAPFASQPNADVMLMCLWMCFLN